MITKTPIITIKLYSSSRFMIIPWYRDFLDTELYKYNMTAKQVNNFKVIIKQALDLAVDRDIIDSNPVDAYKLPTRIRAAAIPEPETQVFKELELAAIYHVTTYRDDKSYIVPLMVEFAFKLGVRNGELVTLKWTDIIDDNHIYIQRTEVRYYEIDAKGNKGNYKHDIDTPKTEQDFVKFF